MDKGTLEFFSKYIERQLGIVYAEFNLFQLQSRIEEVTAALLFPSVEAFRAAAEKGLSEMQRQVLMDIATNNETSFFRDKPVFDWVMTTMLPELVKKSAEPIRIWSAACSYGQEPISLAMIARDLKANVKILATDIASRALARAKQGKFSQLEVQRGLSAPILIKNFFQDGEGWWRAHPELLQMITFETQNLLSSFSQRGMFDVIFCRNVLIYQSVDRKKEIIGRLAAQLKPGALLVLGSGESLIGLSDEFETRNLGGAIAYTKIKKSTASVAA